MLATLRATAAAVVALADGDALRAARAAIAAGARDIVRWPEEADRLPGAIRRAATPGEITGGGRVIAVAGARGGLGVSTVVAALGRSLAGIVIDLDPGAGQRTFTDDAPPRTLDDLRPGAADVAPDALEAALAPHARGARCLHAARVPPEAAEVSGILRAACTLAGVVVVDCGRPSDPGAQAAYATADARLLLAGNDASSVRGARAAVRRPDAVGLRRIRRGGVAIRDLIAALEAEAAVVLPQDGALARAADLGRLPSRATRGLRAIEKLARAVGLRP